ncbi:hypothetical protein JI75_08235 [Berryella intestinalis]|uniref:Uncharacterized protein n=1 Tax=Berryella intestinalis TaxID=1531429 RepID=A0A0A8BBW9_9ACTN|nr:hypothetical protein JI75_08235 [Berryella intestinalis]
MLGSSQLGVYAFTYTIANYFIFFILLGLNQYGVRAIAKVREDRQILSKTFCSIFAMQFLAGAAVTTVYLGYVALSSPDIIRFSLIWCIWVGAEIFDVGWLFFGLEEFKAITIRNVIIRFLVVAGIFLFVHDQEDLWVYCLIQAMGNFVSALVLWPMLAGKVRFALPKLKEIIPHIKPNLVLFAPVIAISFYTQIDKVLLGVLASMSQLGFYDNAEKITLIPLAIIQSLGTAMLPRMSKLVSSGEGESVRGHIGISIWFSTALALGLSFGIAAISPEFVPIFFGEGFEPVATMMPIIGMIIPIVAWSNVLGVQYLIPHGKDVMFLASVSVGAAVNVALNLVMIPLWQGVGSSVATVIAEFAVMLVQVYYLRSELPFRRYLKDVLPYLFIGAAMYGVIRMGVFLPVDGVARLVLEIVVGGSFFLLASIVWMKKTHDGRIKHLLPSRFR